MSQCPSPVFVAAKEFFGSSPSHKPIGSPQNPFQANSPGSKDNWNAVPQPVTSTGKLPALLFRRSRQQAAKEFLGNPPTLNFQDQQQSPLMSGKMTPQLQEPDSSSDDNQSVEAQNVIGREYGTPLSAVRWNQSPLIYELCIIVPHKGSERIMTALEILTLTEKSLYIMVPAGPGNPAEFEMNLLNHFLVKCRTRSFGAVTKVKKTLSWMNFEERSESLTYLDGSTAMVFEWRQKVVL